MAHIGNVEPSIKELFASFLVRQAVKKDFEKLTPEAKAALDKDLVDVDKIDPETNLPQSRNDKKDHGSPLDHKIAIIGCGIAGLYAAHMLDAAKIPYEIFEASDRTGGRLYTHYFTRTPERPHDYYDIGAMRFPDSPIMARTFALFEKLKLPLADYHMECPGQPTRFNDRTIFGFKSKDPELKDPFRVSVKNSGPVPDETVKDPQQILDDAYDYYRAKLKRDPAVGFKYLMQHDKFSLRDYLSFVEGQDDETIAWLETLTSASGWFGMAFTENVLESLAFEYADDIKWKCIDGGTTLLTEGILKIISTPPRLKHQVIKIDQNKQPNCPDNERMIVTFKGPDRSTSSEKFSAVINTTTFGALTKIDLCGLSLPFKFKTAIRSIHYDTSSKIGIKFKYPWWRTHCKMVQGGLGKTDMPIRVCVYPSYNCSDPENESAVLLASYCWGQDAERTSSYITSNSEANKKPEDEPELRDFMIYQLARLHSDNEADFEKLKTIIEDSWIEHHGYDWSRDPNAAGAFALFAPAQFADLYGTLVRPAADSRFFIVGEAASAHHAWIVGALDSSARAIHLLLERFRLYKTQQEITDTFKPTGECDYQTSGLQVALGMLAAKQQPIPDSVKFGSGPS